MKCGSVHATLKPTSKRLSARISIGYTPILRNFFRWNNILFITFSVKREFSKRPAWRAATSTSLRLLRRQHYPSRYFLARWFRICQRRRLKVHCPFLYSRRRSGERSLLWVNLVLWLFIGLKALVSLPCSRGFPPAFLLIASCRLHWVFCRVFWLTTRTC
jgi:hypothetical protein